MPNLLGKLFLTLLNIALILACLTVMAFITWATWGDMGVELGFIWGLTGLAVWAFYMAIKTIWRG